MAEAKKIDTVEFFSPINRENSFTSTNLAKKTKSVMTLYLNRDLTGFIEWDIPALDMTEEIGLEFEIDEKGKRTLTGYDGVFAIPTQALDLLEKNGIDVADMRKSMEE